MKYAPQQYARALYEALKENGDLNLARDVVREFENCARVRDGIFFGELISARPLGARAKAAISDKIAKQISKKQKIQVKEIHLDEKLDPDLIGGCRVRVGDMSIDMSISGALEKIRKQL